VNQLDKLERLTRRQEHPPSQYERAYWQDLSKRPDLVERVMATVLTRCRLFMEELLGQALTGENAFR